MRDRKSIIAPGRTPEALAIQSGFILDTPIGQRQIIKERKENAPEPSGSRDTESVTVTGGKA